MMMMMISKSRCLVTMSQHLEDLRLRVECSVFRAIEQHFFACFHTDLHTEKVQPGSVFLETETEKTAVLSEKARERRRVWELLWDCPESEGSG